MKWGLSNYDDIHDEEGGDGTVDMVVRQKDYVKRCSSEEDCANIWNT